MNKSILIQRLRSIEKTLMDNPDVSNTCIADIHALREVIKMLDNTDMVQSRACFDHEFVAPLMYTDELNTMVKERLYRQVAEYLMDNKYGEIDGPSVVYQDGRFKQYVYDLKLTVTRPYNPAYTYDPINADLEKCPLGLWRPEDN